MRRWTLLWIAGLLTSLPLLGQAQASFAEQLQRIDQLIEDRDSLAIQLLDNMDEEALLLESDAVSMEYYRLKGDYFLTIDQFDKAAEAYESLLSYNHLAIEKTAAGKLARGINDLGIALMRIGEFDRAKKAHYRSLAIYELLEDPQGAAFNYNNLAVLFQSLKQKDSALYHFAKSLEFARIAKDSMGIAFNNQNLGILYGNMNDPVNSIKHYLEAKIAFEQMNRNANAMYSIKGIGFEYNRIGELDSARKYLTINLNYQLEHGSPRRKAGAISAMGELMNKLDKLDSALYFYQSALRQFESIKYSYGMANTHSLMGIIHARKQAYDSAKYHLTLSLDFSENYKGVLESSYSRLGDIYFKTRQYELAISNAKKALEVSNGNATTGHLLMIYQTLFKSYEELQNLDQSFRYLKLYSEAKEEISGKERALDLARIETQISNEKKLNLEREENLKREFVLEKRVLLERGLGMAATVFLSLVLAWVIRDYRNKGRRNLKLHEQNLIIESQKQQLERAAEKERKLLNEQLHAKDRELAILAMQSNEKNDVLKKLKEKIDAGPGSKDGKEIKKLIESNLALDNSWDNFLTKFEDVYPKFFSKMKVEYESLSVNQLKLCAYIKVGMDNSEISKVTNTEMSSVKKNLNRLKKKLNLGPEDSIRTFVMNYA